MGRQSRVRRATLSFDFFGTSTSSTKSITSADLTLPKSRPLRLVRVTVTFAAVGNNSTYGVPPSFPCVQVHLHDTKGDTVAVSAVKVASFSTTTLSVRCPPGTDFGDIDTDNKTCVLLVFPGFVPGVTITYSGTIWVQFGPHRISSKVSALRVLEQFSRDDPRDG